MRRYGDNGDLTFLWPVAPEEPVGTWRLVLHVRFENFRFLIVRMFDRVVFVCIEARVSWVSSNSRTHFSICLNSPSALAAFALRFFWRFNSDAVAASCSSRNFESASSVHRGLNAINLPAAAHSARRPLRDRVPFLQICR
jgi:hypothetical protein